MKYKGLAIGIISMATFFTAGAGYCFSQGTEIDMAGKRRAYVAWSIGPVKNQYRATYARDISAPEIRNSTTLFSSLEAGYFINRHIGLSAGLGISSAEANLTMKSFALSFDTIDAERETYERRIDGNNITEKQKITYLTIPLQLNIQAPLSKGFGFYIQSGVSITFPFKASYLSTGTFTYGGFYPEYNVLLTDISYEGFQSNVKNDVNGKLKIRSAVPEFVSSAGLQFFLRKRFQFSPGLFFSRLLGNPSGYDPVTVFRLSTRPGQMKSMMQGAADLSRSSVGLKLTFRYIL